MSEIYVKGLTEVIDLDNNISLLGSKVDSTSIVASPDDELIWFLASRDIVDVPHGIQRYNFRQIALHTGPDL